jgi:hypothetical protein
MNKVIFSLFLLCQSQILIAQQKINVNFSAIANAKKINFDGSIFKNDFNESYSVSKLKFYISNINLISLAATQLPKKNVFLIDAVSDKTVQISLPKGKIIGITFMLGVDSALHCSGAQTGALDPLNGMFWTWNNGYINFKLEGKFIDSTLQNKKLEHHIGGYKSPFTTLQSVTILFSKNYTFKNNVNIVLNLDAYWNGESKLYINKNPLIGSAGANAFEASLNFGKMFFVSP